MGDILKNKGGRNKRRRGESSDHDTGLKLVKGEGSKWDYGLRKSQPG